MRKLVIGIWWPGLILFALGVATQSSKADIYLPPESIPQAILSESVPEAFDPNDINLSDYTLEWIGAPLAEVQAKIEPNSLQWVRVGELLVLPRARVLLETKTPVKAGQALHAGYAQPFQPQGDGKAAARVPIALISGDTNAIEIIIDNQRRGKLRVRFKPTTSLPKWGVTYDSSCSPFRVHATKVTGNNLNQWAYIGCRLVHVNGERHPSTNLETMFFWDNVGQTIKVDGTDTVSSGTSVWRLRLPPGRRTVTLEAAGGEKITLEYAIPEHDHAAFVGFGIGPYQYTLESEQTNTDTLVAFPTVYMGYFLNETTQLVAFNATAIQRNFFSDFGLYVRSQMARALDNRLVINFMLGAHTLVFKANDVVYLKPTGPQGIEMIYKDFLKPAHNFALGFFIYPLISGKSYYNAWLRWGTSKFFGELNYLTWQEGVGENSDQRVYSRSIGVSIGFPLFSLF